MQHTIRTDTVAARPIAVIAETTTWDKFPQVWRRLLDQVHGNIRWAGSGRKGRNIMFYKDDVPNVEIGVELDQPAEFEAPVIRSALPAGRVVMTLHKGPFTELGSAHDAMWRWCTEHGVQPAGPRWEIYGHHHNDPALLQTEVYYLLRD